MDSLKINFQEGDLPSLHPHLLMVHIRGRTIVKNLYEGLTRLGTNGKPELAGAESAERSPDGLRYTFKLRDNKWSDGTPVTAYHYENAWQEALSPISDCHRADLLYMIKNGEKVKKGELPINALGVKALDDKTLFIELEYPSSYLYELLAQGISAPLADIKEKEPSRFNGPFMVDSWKRGDHLRLKRNPHYWAKKLVSLDQIDVFMVQDVMTAYSMFEKGQIDWVGHPFVHLPPEIIRSLEEQKILRTYPVDRFFWLFINTQIPHLSSPHIRQALSLAIDRDAVTKHILVGNHPLEKPLPFSLQPLAAPLHLEQNLAEAKSKFKIGLKEIGLTEQTFPTLEIAYSQQANRKQFAEYLQQVWSKTFGIKIKAVPEEWNVLRSNLLKGEFQISGCYEVTYFSDPSEVSERFVSLEPSNFSKWTDAEYKNKLLLAKRESNQAKRMQLIRDAEHILLQQMPFIPICSDIFMFAHHPDLDGYVLDGVGSCDFSRARIKKIVAEPVLVAE